MCHIARGGSPRPIQSYLTNNDDGINWIKISDATSSNKYIYETKEKIKPEGVSRSRLVREGDFILSNSMSFGRPYIMKTKGCIHDGWLVLSDKSKLFDQDYLYYFLSSPNAYKQFDSRAVGSTVRNLNTGLVKNVEVPIPTLSEQKRIVEILDEAFEGIDAAIANTEKNLANTCELFDVYLNTIFEDGQKKWNKRILSEVCEVKDGTHDTPKYVENGIPFITQKNIREDGLSFEKVKFISIEDHEFFYRRSNVAFEDILISMIGANRGMSCVVDSKEIFSIKNVGLIKKSEQINPQFLQYYLKSKMGRDYVQEASRGGAQEFIGLTALRNFPVYVPEITLQEQLFDNLDKLKKQTQYLEDIYEQKIASLNELKQSLLQKAFRGELTSSSDALAEVAA